MLSHLFQIAIYMTAFHVFMNLCHFFLKYLLKSLPIFYFGHLLNIELYFFLCILDTNYLSKM